MLLIYPPAARSTEPPLGIARLAGTLKRNGVPARCLDLCREGLDYLLGLDPVARDTWTRGALRRRGRNRALLRDPATYANRDRYRRVVGDLNRALKAASAPCGAEAGLADYRERPARRLGIMYSILVAVAVGLLFGVGGMVFWWGWVWALVFGLLVALVTLVLVLRTVARRLQPALTLVRKQAEAGAYWATMQSLRALLPRSRWMPLLKEPAAGADGSARVPGR